MERREMVGGGILAGLTSLVAAPSSEAAAQRDGGDEKVADALDTLRRSFDRQIDVTVGPWRFVRQIREQQRIFIRGNQRFPEFIEIGLQAWESVYDWHVSHLQPVTTTRTPDGRYTMLFMFTTLVLRPELELNYVGFGYDGERSPVR